ncbi:MAG: SUMF1/EgtB/PvdO family nonheme iron enzyme [Helicobacteraceae bacterium]|nr:SUMF1/EgtB/PvdO family nonheme iron enzyme [Helicobacteraceae bacterium]
MINITLPTDLAEESNNNWLERANIALSSNDFTALGELAFELENISTTTVEYSDEKLWKNTLARAKGCITNTEEIAIYKSYINSSTSREFADEATTLIQQLLYMDKAPELVIINEGILMMGNENLSHDEPLIKVRLDYKFLISKYAVTFDEYDFFCEQTNRIKVPDEGHGRGRNPVINVNWTDAVEYCKWIRKKTGKKFKLPSEAEWEYACKAGTTTDFSFGDDSSKLGEYAWYDENAFKIETDMRQYGVNHVGKKKPNPWGLYDMHGNVWEWCEDWHIDHNLDHYAKKGAKGDYDANYDGLSEIVKEKKYKVLRGGSWDFDANYCFSSFHNQSIPTQKSVNIGFRVVIQLANEDI